MVLQNAYLLSKNKKSQWILLQLPILILVLCNEKLSSTCLTLTPQTQHLKVNQIKSHSPLAEKIKYLQDNFDTFNLIKMRLSHLLGVMQIITLYKKDKLSFLKDES